MSGPHVPEGDALHTRLAVAKAGQLIRTRLGLAARKVRSAGQTNLPFADVQPPPQLPHHPLQPAQDAHARQSESASSKSGPSRARGLGFGLGLPSGPSVADESAPAPTRPLASRPAGDTTPKQNMYEMMLHPRMEDVVNHAGIDDEDDQLDRSALGGLGYGFPSGRASSGTNGTSSYSAYRGVSSAHHHNRNNNVPQASSSSPFEQPYDSHTPLSPSLYLASPDPGQGASAFFPSHSHYPQRPRTPSSSARDDTARNFDSLFPSASSGEFPPSHGSLDPPYSPLRRIASGAKAPLHLAGSPRGAFGRSPSATYASRANGTGGPFSFAHSHAGSPGLAASPKMSSARTTAAMGPPPRQPPIASPSGPLYPSHLGFGRDRIPSVGSSSLAGAAGVSPRGHRRTVSSTLSAVVNLQNARRANANANLSPDRKRRLPSGGHFSPTNSPEKKKARSLSYGSLPPPDLPLRRKPGASRLGGGGETADVAGLEESAASALASMLATHGKDGSEGSTTDGNSTAEGSHPTPRTPGAPVRLRATGTPPPTQIGEETDESAAGMLIFLHHSPSPAKTKSAAAVRTPGGGMGSGTPSRGRVLMFDDHPPPSLRSPKSISKSTLPFPPSFITSPPTRPASPIPLAPSHSQSEGLVEDPSRHLSPIPTSSAHSPRGPFFSPPPSQPLTVLSAASSLDNIDVETRRDDPEEILGSQKDPRDRRRPPSPSPTLAGQALPQGPTPSWPDFDFLTASSTDRTPTPPPMSHPVELGGEKLSGLV